MSAKADVAVILLVDDEPEVTEALKRSLRREPFEFLTATSGKAALEILAAHHVDVVVSDEQMPGMAGSGLMQLVRKQYPRTIRMILTGAASLDAAMRAINEGEVYRFFLKPCNTTDLVHSVKQAVIHQRLEEHSRRMLREYQRQATLIARLELHGRDLLRLETDEQGALVVDESESEGDVMDLLADMEAAMKQR
ncbi:MAG: response regulator [Gammaproteobacteria bacterium]|nr:response regulator [Gammaproteobacteria bacterium]